MSMSSMSEVAKPSRPNISTAMDRLDAAIESLSDQLERTRARIDPVLFAPDSKEPGQDTEDRKEASSLHQAILERVDRIQRMTASVSEMNYRIDL